jgi:hypothetical protein
MAGNVYSNNNTHNIGVNALRYGGSEATPTAVADTYTLFAFNIKGYDGDSLEYACRLLGKVDGTVSDGVVPGIFRFRVNDDTGSQNTVAEFDKKRNVLVNGATAGTNMVGGISMIIGTSPTANAANCVSIYPEDVTAKAELFAMDEDGNDTQLTPHNFSLFTPDPSYVYPWSYFARNRHIGKEINVDMYGAIAAIETLTGKKFIYTRDLPPEECVDWDTQQAINETSHDKKEQERISDEVSILMEKEKEVTKAEAVELAEIMKRDKSKTEKIKVIDTKTGNVVEKPKIVEIGTGQYHHRLKKGYRMDEKTGKFYRLKTEAEALAEVDPATPYVPKEPSAWMIPLMPSK